MKQPHEGQSPRRGQFVRWLLKQGLTTTQIQMAAILFAVNGYESAARFVAKMQSLETKMTPNGALPDYLLIADDAGKWHLTDRHGALLMNVSNPDTLKEMMREAGARFQIIDPRQRLEQQKGTP